MRVNDSEILIKKYDYEKTRDELEEIFTDYVEARFKFIELSEPNITSNYEIRYEAPTNFISNPTSYISINRLETLEQLNYFYDILSKVSQKLNKYERGYLVCCLLNDESEDVLTEKLAISKTKMVKNKKTCVIKTGLAFGVAYLK